MAKTSKKTSKRRVVAAKAAGVQNLGRALEAVVEAEQKIVREAEVEVYHDVDEARHALDRMHYWGGAILLILAGVLFLNGVDPKMFMGVGLAGALASMIE